MLFSDWLEVQKEVPEDQKLMKLQMMMTLKKSANVDVKKEKKKGERKGKNLSM